MVVAPAPTKQREEGWTYWTDVLDGYGRRLLAFVSEYGHWRLVLRVERMDAQPEDRRTFITAFKGRTPVEVLPPHTRTTARRALEKWLKRFNWEIERKN